MRVIKKVNTKTFTPVDISSLIVSEDDCFGREWDNVDPSCVKCSSYETCMILSLSTNNKKEQTLKTGKHFFDELDWSLVNWGELSQMIKDNPKTISLNDLKGVVKTASKCIDNVTVHSKVQNWIIENKIKLDEGCLYF